MNHIVCGPPGSGKSSYVLQRVGSCDVVVDVDALYHAITFLPYYDKPQSLLDLVLTVRDVLIANLPRYRDRYYNAWVITSGASMLSRAKLAVRLNADVIVLEISPQECMRRIAHDPRRSANAAAWQQLVAAWWNDYEPCDSDIVLKADWESSPCRP